MTATNSPAGTVRSRLLSARTSAPPDRCTLRALGDEDRLEHRDHLLLDNGYLDRRIVRRAA